jgi:hypothetical protein
MNAANLNMQRKGTANRGSNSNSNQQRALGGSFRQPHGGQFQSFHVQTSNQAMMSFDAANNNQPPAGGNARQLNVNQGDTSMSIGGSKGNNGQRDQVMENYNSNNF